MKRVRRVARLTVPLLLGGASPAFAHGEQLLLWLALPPAAVIVTTVVVVLAFPARALRKIAVGLAAIASSLAGTWALIFARVADWRWYFALPFAAPAVVCLIGWKWVRAPDQAGATPRT